MDQDMTLGDLVVVGLLLLGLFAGCGAAWSLGTDECRERGLGGCSELRR
jgi:hypothetical protein